MTSHHRASGWFPIAGNHPTRPGIGTNRGTTPTKSPLTSREPPPEPPGTTSPAGWEPVGVPIGDPLVPGSPGTVQPHNQGAP